MNRRYYHLALPETWWCGPSPRWVMQQQQACFLCTICQRIKRGWFPTPLDVVYDRPVRPYHILETSQAGIALIDKRLLQRLGPHLPPLAIGRALDKNGNEVATHATAYVAPESVVDSRHYPPQDISVCPECGTIRAAPASEEPDYLLSYNLRDRPCVMDRIGCLYVREDVAKALDLSDLKPLYLQEIEVKDKPLDGLRFPDDPPWVQGRDASVSWNPAEGDP